MLENKYIHKIIYKENEKLDNYLINLPVVKYLKNNEIILNKNVTFVVGENGIGKSSFIEAVAVSFGFNPEGGSKNFNFSTNISHSNLYKNIILSKKKYPKDGYFLRAESFYNVASNIQELDAEPKGPKIINSYGGISLHEQSHGESFMSLVHNRFTGNGLYILDEPEAALSPTRLLSLLIEIDRLVKKDSQLIIATHSPILLAYPDSEVFELTENGINIVNFKETDHYKVTKNFLNNPERTLKYLFEE